MVKALSTIEGYISFARVDMTNYYWPVYKSLEQELANISNIIHIDDKQMYVYSVKIAELLLRCVVEIESISKELYIKHGGTPPAKDAHLYFDTDCIDFLESKWMLSKKKVIVSATNFYFQQNDNKELFPLNKANKRGSSSADWAKAYQAVKHNRVVNISKANIKHLIRAMAALYILNIYYRDDIFTLSNNNDKDFLSSWSDFFNINVHAWRGSDGSGWYMKKEDFDESIYFIRFTDNYQKRFNDWNTEQEKIALEKILQNPKIISQIQQLVKNGANIQDPNLSFWKDREWLEHLDIQKDYSPIVLRAQREATQKTGFDLVKHKPEFEAILNKNQVP